MVILIHSDYPVDVFPELDRLRSMPTLSMTARLDMVLELGFDTARARVDVETGRLKASGKKNSKVLGSQWVGEFTFDAENEDGVAYGMYERERGGKHDFFSQTYLLDGMFRIALIGGLEDRNG